MTAYYLVLLLIIPLIVSNSFVQGFELPKIIAFYLVTELMAIFVLIKHRKTLHFDRWDLVSITFLGLAIISSLLAHNFYHSFIGGPYRFQGILTIFHLILLFIITRQIKTINIGRLFTYAGIIQSIILFVQFAEVRFLDLPITTYSGRVIGTMGQPGFVAGFLIAAFGFSLGGNVLVTIILALGILATQSLGGILAIGILIPLYLLKTKQNKLFIFPIVLVLIIIGFIGLKKEKITLDFMNTPRVESRLSIWPASINLFLKRPLVGYGVENMAYVFPPEFGGSSIDRAHNATLDNLLSGGVFMGLIYLIFTFTGLTKTWNEKNKLPLFLALLGVFVCDQVNVPGIVNLLTFWLLLGLAI